MLGIFHSLTKRSSTRQVMQRATFRPRMEILEDRLVPATLGPEFTPTALTHGTQSNPAVASGRNGLHVIVWQYRASSHNHNIYARVIDQSGEQPTSHDILVTASHRDEIDPAVAFDNKGNFVVTWAYEAGHNNYNIAAAQFTSTGARRNGGNFTVASQTWNESDPDVALSGHGHIVITYHRRDHVYARMHHDNRAYVRDISVSTTSKMEHSAKVARSADGRFSVAYVIDVNSGDVRLRRYNASGDLMQRRTVATSYRAETHPSVSMNHRGDTLIGWRTSSHYYDPELIYNESFYNAVQARMVYYTGRLGPVRTLESGSYEDDSSDGDLNYAYGHEVHAPYLSLQQDGHNDRFVIVFEQATSWYRSDPHTEFVVYDYSEDRAIDRSTLDDQKHAAFVSWSKNRDEALIAWADFDADIKARKLTI